MKRGKSADSPPWRLYRHLRYRGTSTLNRSLAVKRCSSSCTFLWLLVLNYVCEWRLKRIKRWKCNPSLRVAALKPAPIILVFWTLHNPDLALLASRALRTHRSRDFLPSVFMFLLIICCKCCWRAEGQPRVAERLAVTSVQLCRATSVAWTGCYQCSCI